MSAPESAVVEGKAVPAAAGDQRFNLVVVCDKTKPFLKLLEELPPQFTVTAVGTDDLPDEALAGADVCLYFAGLAPAFLERLWPRMPRLRWLHSFSAGVNHLLFPALLESPVVFTRAKGVYGRALAEFVMLSCMFFARDVRRSLRSQQAGVWDPYQVEPLHDRVLGVVGYGDIGRECARYARNFGMRVVALRNRPHEPLPADDPAERIYGRDGLHDLMAESDYVVVVTPLVEGPGGTRGLIDDAAVRAMKRTGVLINIGRGPVVEEKALISALTERRIRGAALDVFDVEPLPKDNPLYKLDNVYFSAHAADNTETAHFDSTRLFISNARLFVEGKPLVGVVDKKLGY